MLPRGWVTVRCASGEGPSTVPTGFPAGKFGDSAAELTQALEAAGFSQVSSGLVGRTSQLATRASRVSRPFWLV